MTILDEDGTELEDQKEAQLEAVRYAGEVIKDDRKHLALGQEWRMEVTDNAGLVLFRLDFMLCGKHDVPGSEAWEMTSEDKVTCAECLEVAGLPADS